MGEQRGSVKKLSHLNGEVLASLYCTRPEEQVEHESGNRGDKVELVGPKERVEEQQTGGSSTK